MVPTTRRTRDRAQSSRRQYTGCRSGWRASQLVCRMRSGRLHRRCCASCHRMKMLGCGSCHRTPCSRSPLSGPYNPGQRRKGHLRKVSSFSATKRAAVWGRGFKLTSHQANYLLRRSPGAPFPPDPRPATTETVRQRNGGLYKKERHFGCRSVPPPATTGQHSTAFYEPAEVCRHQSDQFPEILQ